MDLRERVEEIQKRKEERENALKQKILYLKRGLVILAGLAVIALIIFGIKSCASSVSARRAEKEAAEKARIEAQQAAEEAAKTQNTVAVNGGVDQEFYKNSAFVGNSFADGMEIYNLVDGADFFARVGLSVEDAEKLSTTTGKVSVIDELDRDKKYSKIFFMFGENELGWLDESVFISKYEALINKAKKYQPDADIYLLAITPVTEAVSKKGEDGATNENVARFNKLILQVAQDVNVNFADIYSAVVNDKGCLPEDAASDGVHFNKEYYKKCLVYIQEEFRQ